MTMQIIHQTPTYVLEADFAHDLARDIHTLDLYQTWPTMAKPYRRRVAQFNLPRAALSRLGEAIAEAAHGPA
jgi:hypothetical protein